MVSLQAWLQITFLDSFIFLVPTAISSFLAYKLSRAAGARIYSRGKHILSKVCGVILYLILSPIFLLFTSILFGAPAMGLSGVGEGGAMVAAVFGIYFIPVAVLIWAVGMFFLLDRISRGVKIGKNNQTQ